MKLSEIMPLLSGVFGEGRVAYEAFPDDETPELPYCVWTAQPSNNFEADNVSFLRIDRVRVTVITASVDLAVEAALEAELAEAGQGWNKSEPGYLSDEKVYEREYEFEVINDA